MPIPISRSPPRSVAAIWASLKGWNHLRRLTTRSTSGTIDLPRGLLEAISLLESEPAFAEVFSPEFIAIYAGVKRGEFETFMQVISPWEREFLLLNV